MSQPLGANIFAFKYLLVYFALAALPGSHSSVCSAGRRRWCRASTGSLTEANDFLASISMKIAKYLSPQIYKSIFSGQRDVAIATERKKLTIFFSDIKDFTATAERLQPEDLTALLNEYLTEMSEDRPQAWRDRRQVHRRRDAGVLRGSRDQGRRRGRARLPAHGG